MSDNANQTQPDLSSVPMSSHRDGANAAARAIEEYRGQISQMEGQRQEIQDAMRAGASSSRSLGA